MSPFSVKLEESDEYWISKNNVFEKSRNQEAVLFKDFKALTER